ncbi:MAG: transglycosylase domain-containing protein [Lachnospiraceae bacterium]
MSKKKKHKGFRRFVLIQGILLLLVIGFLSLYAYNGYGEEVTKLSNEARKLVDASDVSTFKQSQTSIIYDADGNIISKLKGERDTYYLSISQIPMQAQQAMVSIEDKKFYDHKGVDYKAILRAVIAMVKNQKVTQGASTITQQLARNIFLSQERTWQRKVEEIFIALRLEKKYTKNEILEFYFNNIYFANGYYGIQAASKGYFNTEVQNLGLSQLAFLCAIPNNPSLYDPVTHMKQTLKRRDRILKQMYQDGKISLGDYNLAKAEQITLNCPPKVDKNDYVETYAAYCAVQALMEEQGFEFQEYFDTEEEKESYERWYNETYEQCQHKLYTEGYRIDTSLDVDMQEKLQQSIDSNLAEYTTVNEQGVFELQSAGVCIDNKTGFVKAIVGGRKQDFSGYTLNRAYQSFRQPGSALKPLIVYTPQLANGYTPDTIVEDTPIENGPANAGNAYSGSITLRSAVEHSKNVVAWRLLDELTPKKGLEYLKNMQFSKLDAADECLPAALGGLTHGVSPLEMASGYATIENDGKYRKPTCIVMIKDAAGEQIYSGEQKEKEIYTQNAARTMTDILTGVLTNGTAAGMGISEMPSAGKTGTTNDNKDGWFVGFTRYYTTSVWVGYDMPRQVPGLTGSSYPVQIWHDFMEEMHQNLEPLEFLPTQAELSGSVQEELQPESEPSQEEENLNVQPVESQQSQDQQMQQP